MIFWTGWGILVLPLIPLTAFLIDRIWSVLPIPAQQVYLTNIGLLLGFCAAGIVIYYLGKALNKKSLNRVFIDKETGREFVSGPRHTFFFVRFERCGFIIPIIGVIAYFASVN